MLGDELAPLLGDLDQLVVVDVYAGGLGDQPQRGLVRRATRACRVRQRSRSASNPTSDPRARHATVASVGSVTRTCSRSGLLIAAAQRSSTLPRWSSSGNSADPAVGDPSEHDDVHPRAGQPVDQERDLVSVAPASSSWPTTTVCRCLQGPAADRAPGALDVLAAQPPGAVLAAELDGGAERLVGRLRRGGDPGSASASRCCSSAAVISGTPVCGSPTRRNDLGLAMAPRSRGSRTRR